MNLAKSSTALYISLQTGGIYCLLFSQQVSESEKIRMGSDGPQIIISYGNLYFKWGLQSHNNGLPGESGRHISWMNRTRRSDLLFGLSGVLGAKLLPAVTHPKPSLFLCVPMTNSHMDVLGQDSGNHFLRAKAGQHKAKQGTGDSNPQKVLNVQSQQHLGAHTVKGRKFCQPTKDE